MHTASTTHIDSDKPAGLSRLELALCVGASVGVFFLYQGPFWRHRWHLDGSIGYSYLAIPALVATVLTWRRKLVLREVILGTIEVACWKFGVTYLVAHTMWMFSAPPPRAAVPAVSLPDA